MPPKTRGCCSNALRGRNLALPHWCTLEWPPACNPRQMYSICGESRRHLLCRRVFIRPQIGSFEHKHEVGRLPVNEVATDAVLGLLPIIRRLSIDFFLALLIEPEQCRNDQALAGPLHGVVLVCVDAADRKAAKPTAGRVSWCSCSSSFQPLVSRRDGRSLHNHQC